MCVCVCVCLCATEAVFQVITSGLFCIFKPPTPQENIQTLSESQIRTPLEDFAMPTANNNIRAIGPTLKDDNIELIEA